MSNKWAAFGHVTIQRYAIIGAMLYIFIMLYIYIKMNGQKWYRADLLFSCIYFFIDLHEQLSATLCVTRSSVKSTKPPIPL